MVPETVGALASCLIVGVGEVLGGWLCLLYIN